MLLVLLALPAVLEHVLEAAQPPPPAEAAGKKKMAVAGGPAGGRGAATQRALLVAGLVRSAAAFCATLSAGVQRRHLYAWALFAPKFAFEACFLLLADAALLLLSCTAN